MSTRAGRCVAVAICGLLVALIGCSGSDVECRVGADCASGVCLGNGTCAQSDDGDYGRDEDSLPDVPDGTDDTPVEDDGAEDEAETIGCSPNGDGVIARDEVPLRAGLRATFLIGLDATVDLAGAANPDGSRTWDLSGALAGDHTELVELQALTGAWFAPVFAGATYAARLSDTEELLGVFEVTPDALLLRGVVSPAGGLTRTELSYDPPVTVLAFPIALDGTWTTTSTVTGLALGVASFYTESYESQVDAGGTLRTPYGDFDVLRVRVRMVRTVGVVPTVTRSFLFVAECFGTVAAATSQPNEPNVEFTDAAEVRRLTP
jgi:hypothetical protein